MLLIALIPLNFSKQNMSAADTKHLFHVAMTCDGCKGAVSRILDKIPAVQSYEASVEQRTVVVQGDVDPQIVFQKLKKWGDAAGKLVEYVGVTN